MSSVFLTARWKHIVLINFRVDPALLADVLPGDTELDAFDGEAHISLVGFMFEKVRIYTIPLPFHRKFEEINLRFYVRRKVDGQWRRGVVFIREFVPKPAVTWVARRLYHENYATALMSHQIELDSAGRCMSASYDWKIDGATHQIHCDSPRHHNVSSNDRARFFADHFWGYSRMPDGRTIEYQVDHPPWPLYEPSRVQLIGDLSNAYGSRFAQTFAEGPQSVIYTEGSEISVHRGAVL